MNAPCAKCNKTVYPVEKLSCLDKTWHKLCFKCDVCGLQLNMKNYKGYQKKPYCNVHYPTTKFTQVADTPENKRIAGNSKLQSQVQYHSDFEEQKGQYTFVPDNPESVRLAALTKAISLVEYHKKFETEKGSYTQVADDPETRRAKKNMQNFSNLSYHKDVDKKAQMEGARPAYEAQGDAGSRHSSTSSQPYRRQPGSISDYDPMEGSDVGPSPYTNRAQSNTVFSSGGGGSAYQAYSPRRVGSIAEYDPLNEHYGSIVGQYSSGSVPQASNRSPGYHAGAGHGPQFGLPPAQPAAAQPPPPQQYEPPREPQQPQFVPYEPENTSPPASSGAGQYVAIYDYAAADDDEVSFNEGDIIVNVERIDEGWMTGTVQSTGQHGMLPANYVDQQ